MSTPSLPDVSSTVKPELRPSTRAAWDFLRVWLGISMRCNVAHAVLILVTWLA